MSGPLDRPSSEGPSSEGPSSEGPSSEGPRSEGPRSDGPRSDAARSDGARADRALLHRTLGALVAPLLGAREIALGRPVGFEALIEARVRSLGLRSESDYVEHVRLAPDEELIHLAGAFTNGWTWFFRDPQPIEALAVELAARGKGVPSRVWVAGCSTGEEAYSVVIACLERGVDVTVLGTDIDASRLEHAARGVYPLSSLRRMSAEIVERYFEPASAQEVQVRPLLRRRVAFRVHNVLHPPEPPPSGARWDAIVCRNVLLHLSELAARRALQQLEAARAPVLLLAPADRLPTLVHSSTGPTRPAASRPVPPLRQVERAARTDGWAEIRERIRRGEHEGARALLEDLARKDSEGARAHLALGNLALHANDLSRAAADYARAEHLAPTSFELHFLWGTLHRRLGAWEQAVASLRRALFLDPDLWPAWFLLAGALERAGRPVEAGWARRETALALERRGQVAWVSFVDDLEGVACPRALVHAASAGSTDDQHQMDQNDVGGGRDG